MPKLLHVIGGSAFGGASLVVMDLAVAAQSMGFEVDCLTTDERLASELEARNIGVVSLDLIRRDIRPIWDANGARRLGKFLAQSDYMIVHTHTSKAGFVGRLAAFSARIPIVVHSVHGFPFHELSSWPAFQTYRFAEWLAAHWCDRIVTVSNYHRDLALNVGIGDPTSVIAIPNGVAVDRLVPSRGRELTRQSLGLTPDTLSVLVPGRIASQKGIKYLIQALPLLEDRWEGVKVLLAGDGPERSDIRQLVADLEQQSRVEFLGFRTDMADLYAAADIVAMPTLQEGLSMSLLEAMAAGKPVITTDIPSNLEATKGGEAAILVSPKQPQALALGLQRLLLDVDLRERLGTEARRVVLDTYTLEGMLNAYIQLYEQLLAEKGLAPWAS